MVAAVAVDGRRRSGDDPVVAGQGAVEQPLHHLALFPRAPPRPRLPGAVDRHDRGRRRRRRAGAQDEQGSGQADPLGPGAADPSARRAGVAAGRRPWRRAAEVREPCSTIPKCGCSACAGSISRPNGSATAMPPGTMPAAPPRSRRNSPGRPNRHSRTADRARRLGRRAETGRRAEVDAADRTRCRQPPPRRAADRQGHGAGRQRSAAARAAALEANKLRPELRAGGRCRGAALFGRTTCARAPRSSRRRGRSSRIRRSASSMCMPGRATPCRPAEPGEEAAGDEAEQRRDRDGGRAGRTRGARFRGGPRQAPKRRCAWTAAKALICCLADIEEAENGDQGRVRYYLARAVRAPRDPAWVADGIVSDRWAPVSPVTGRLDAFEWRMPVERLGPVIDSRRRGRPGSAATGVAGAQAGTGGSDGNGARGARRGRAGRACCAARRRSAGAAATARQAGTAGRTRRAAAARAGTRPSRARPNAEADEENLVLPTLMPDDPGVDGTRRSTPPPVPAV